MNKSIELDELLLFSDGSTYFLARVAMLRALELEEGSRALVEHGVYEKKTTIALREIAQGKISFVKSAVKMNAEEKEEKMEKGKVKSVSGHDNKGIIVDVQGATLDFNNSSIVGKDRSSLKAGDQVYFERIGADTDIKAINIRRC